MRKKCKTWIPVSDAIKNAFKRLGLSKKVHRFEVWNCWEQIAGPSISSHARPARWQGTILVVSVEHSSWMQELSFLKTEILEKIRSSIPHIDISDIRFEIGKMTKDAPVETLQTVFKPAPLSADEKEFIEQAANQLQDESARNALRRLMTRDFQQKKKIK